MVYGYHFSHMYGGKYYQRKAFMSEAHVVFMDYSRHQMEYFKDHGNYDQEFHKLNIAPRTRNFKIGFANKDAYIKKINQNCMISNLSYLICAYGKYKGEVIFIEMNEKGIKRERDVSDVN
jgi:hypothetical protein